MSDIVYIGLGSNEGDREGQLLSALKTLSRIDAVAVLGCSSLYETAPIGPAQPRFLNAVVALECDLPPGRLLGILKQIEKDAGRRPHEMRWGPRCIDLDILLWGEQVVADANLQIPHLELHKRRFALEPLCELAPDAFHPLLGTTASELLSKLPRQDVVRYQSSDWPEQQATGTDDP